MMEIHLIIIAGEFILLIGGYLFLRFYRRKSAENGSERPEIWSEYMNSRKWEDLRREALKRADYKCELCNASYKAVHHIRYPKKYRDDHADNLLVVCKKCHAKLHGIRDEAMMSDNEILYSEEVRTGSHTYSFHLKNSSAGKKFLYLTESGRRGTRCIDAEEDILQEFTENMKNGLNSLKNTAGILFEKRMSGGDQTYFFEVKSAVNKSRYLKITESRRKDYTVFEQDHIIIFEDEARMVLVGLENAINFIRKN
ncbi:MAG: DUF3276 family protein [Candidatus Electronema sp. VV]